MKPEPKRYDRILHLPRKRETPGVRRLAHNSPADLQAPGLFMAAPAMAAGDTGGLEPVRVMVKKSRRLIKPEA